MALVLNCKGNLLYVPASGRLANSVNCCDPAGCCCAPSVIEYSLPTSGECVGLFIPDCGSSASQSQKWYVDALPGTHSASNPLVGYLDPEDLCGVGIDPETDDLCWSFETTLRDIGSRDRWLSSGSCSGSPDDTVDLFAVIYGGYLRARGKLFAVIEAVLNPSDPERDHLIFAGVAPYDGRLTSLPVTINNQITGVGQVCCVSPFRRIDAGAYGGSITFRAS